MKKQIITLFAIVFSLSLSAQSISNTTSCNFEVEMHIQSITSSCGPSLGSMAISVNPGINPLPALPPGYEFFAAEVKEPSGTFILGVASACSSCGATSASGSYACTVSGNVIANWTTCTSLILSD